MYYHVSHKKALPIIKEISSSLTAEQYEQLMQESFFLAHSKIINLHKVDENHNFTSEILTIIKQEIKWCDFINLLKMYPIDNEFIFINSIEQTDNKRIRKIEDFLDEEINERFFTIRFTKSTICPILHSPYLKKCKEN